MGALAEIIQQQGGKDEIEPGAIDRLAPEMPHIGIERLCPRHRQDHGAQQDAVNDQEGQ